MAVIPTQAVTITGAALTLSAATTGGDTVQCDDDVMVVISNTSGAAVTVTAAVTKREAGNLVVPNVPVTVAAGAIAMFGPTRPDLFANASDNRLHLTYSLATGVLVAAVSL